MLKERKGLKESKDVEATQEKTLSEEPQALAEEDVQMETAIPEPAQEIMSSNEAPNEPMCVPVYTTIGYEHQRIPWSLQYNITPIYKRPYWL